MQGKGAGPVNRVELESQVLCAALRQSSHNKDKIGAFTSVRELSHLFPDLLPPPEKDDEQANSNKANYYALLKIKPQTAPNGVLSSYLRAVRRFLRTRNASEGRLEYSHILNAGFILRKPRLRLSHDLVVARRWLHEESRMAATEALAKPEITHEQTPVLKTAPPQPAAPLPPAAPPLPPAAASPSLPPQAAAPPPSPPPLPALTPTMPVPTLTPPPLPPVQATTAGSHQDNAQTVEIARAAETVEIARAEPTVEISKPDQTIEIARPPAEQPVAVAVAQAATTPSDVVPVAKAASPAAAQKAASAAPSFEAPPLSPLAAKLAQPPEPGTSELLPAGIKEAVRPQVKENQPVVSPEAPPPPAPRYEPMPSPAPAPAAPKEESDEPHVLPAAMRAQQAAEVAAAAPAPRPPGRIGKEAAFVFDESQLRKPQLPNEKPLPMLVMLLEAAQVIGPVEVQALKAQIERAPNVPVEKHILNAGYITASELNSVKLGENLLQRGKINMAQFQVAFYDERYSGLRMAESLQVRGWLSVEVRNAIDEWKNQPT